MKKISLLIAAFLIFFASFGSAWAVSEIDLYFPPAWHDQPEEAYKIAYGLSQKLGINIIPHIADCYPEILTALSQEKPLLAYVDSMVQAIALSRKFGAPLLQALDNNQNYGGVLLYPKGMSPSTILADHPAEIAFTIGTTSGEVCAKVATRGKASIAMSDQRTAVGSIRTGKAKAAFVKNTWWAENYNDFPGLDLYRVPGVSDFDNADNVLLASDFVSSEIKSLILSTAIKHPQIFNADLVVPFDSFFHWFTMILMNKAGIDPLTYTWPSGQCVGAPDVSSTLPPEAASQNKMNLTAGKLVLEKNCRRCHLIEKVKKYRRKTREQWESTLTRKSDNGVKLTKTEQTDLINYLLSLKRK